ncbi:MAG: hypothetical protein HDS48_07040 [Bacteroides sp.]|nr:hypothetical protein [Bacteroides sp.]
MQILTRLLTAVLLTLTGAHTAVASVNVPLPEQGLWPESPQVAKLNAATMPSPDLSTGAATFSIPLYTLKVDDLELPLELRYRSNGIRVEEDPYPIGYGWSFLPALRVTRTVYNRPDGKYRFIGTGESESLTHSQMHLAMVKRDGLLSREGLDSERDIFTIHMPEATFNAYLDGGTLVAPGHGEYRMSADASLDTITVTDPLGRTWVFSEKGARWMTEDPVEWGLTSVTLPSGRKITFRWGFGQHSPSPSGALHSYSYFRALSLNGPIPSPESAGTCNVEQIPSPRSLNLTSIEFPGGTVTLAYNTSSSAHTTLSSITVRARTSTVRTVTLTHGISVSDRTMLKTVEISGGERYSFEYNPYTFTSSDSQDYWGFYNRGAKGLCDVPSMRITDSNGRSTTIEGSDRSPSEEYMKARTLTKVTYPTGGTLEIEYEPHRFSPLDFIDDPRISATKDRTLTFGGGLRVSSLTLRESAAAPARTVRYEYGRDGDGKATVDAWPTASSFITETVFVAPWGYVGSSPSDPSVCQYGHITASPYSTYQAYRTGEECIWYPEVAEVHPEGKVVHHFEKLMENLVAYSAFEDPTPVNLVSVFTGCLAETAGETYSGTGGSYTLVERWTREHDISIDGSAARGIMIRRRMTQSAYGRTSPDFTESKEISFITPTQNIASFTYGEHSIYSSRSYTISPVVVRPGEMTRTLVTPTGNITTTETWDYVDGTQIMSSRRLSNSARTLTTEYFHTDSISTSVASAMKAANIVGRVTGMRESFGGVSTGYMLQNSRVGTGNLFLPTRILLGRGGVPHHSTATYAWNTDGTLASRTGADGVTTAWTWDANGRNPLSQTIGGTLESKATWNDLVGVATLTDPAGLETEFSYDAGGRLSSVKAGGRLLQSFLYSVSQTGASSVTSLRYTAPGVSVASTDRVDGLGRVWATVTGLPGGDVVTMCEYDAMGRLSRSWAPAPSSSLSENADQIRAAARSHHGLTYPYSENAYEKSTRGVLLSSTPAGDAWHTNSRKRTVAIMANTASGTYACNRYTPAADRVTLSGVWPAGSLTVEVTTDEDGAVSMVFTDLRGLKVCERIDGQSTYYVHDGYGDLRYILPPGASAGGPRTSSVMRELAFWYHYDSRGRCVTRKLPGIAAARMLYDPADRLVAEQTANHPSGSWRLYAYDRCGRIVVTFDTGMTDSQATAFASVCRTASLTGSGNLRGYTLSPAPSTLGTIPSMINAMYYDDYSFIDLMNIGSGFKFRDPFSISGMSTRIPTYFKATSYTGGTSGKLTGRFTGAGWEVYHYNTMGLEMQRTATGYNTGTRTTFYNYDLTPASVHYSYAGAYNDRDTYLTYDKAGRQTRIRHVEHLRSGTTTVTDSAVIVTDYDRIGRVGTITMGKSVMSYTYDVHGWLKGTTGILRQTLFYADGGKPRYNGSISRREWDYHAYDYTYSNAGFLTAADYSELTGNTQATGPNAGVRFDYSASYVHDLRGNLTSMVRKGIIDTHPSTRKTFGTLDDMSATYTGNRLTSMDIDSDAGIFATQTGLRNTGSFTLSYDDAGRLTADPVRGITSMVYDNNGLVREVHTTAGEIRNSIRDTNGNLMRVIVTGNTARNVIRTTIYTGDGHVMVNDTLQMARFPGGYFSHDGKPHYYIKDYQGNNVKVVDADGGVRQTTNYYPYGEPWTEWNWTLADRTPMCRNRFLFGDKERIPEYGLNEYDFAARQYVPAQMRFSTPDPKAEERPGLSPYIFGNSNPVMFIDPSGENPIYDISGNFMGIDDKGLRGNPIIMDSNNFENGMPNEKTLEYMYDGDISKEVWNKIQSHHSQLSDRPDYDGVVTMQEGIQWAKQHPNALKNPTPDNMLYIDTSKLDFGPLSESSFPQVNIKQSINLFKDYKSALFKSLFNSRFRDTVYGLGRCEMMLLDRTNRTVKVIDGNANDYDWNLGGESHRNTAIIINNYIFKINPDIHGFKTFYYGIGHLNQ